MSVDELSPSALALVAERIRDGDSSAEEELVRQFTERIRVFVGMRTRDRELARDLAQDVMLQVISALRRGQLREPERLGAFVYGIARNLVNNHFRTGGRSQAEPLPLDLPADDAGPEERLAIAQRQGVVRRALARLDGGDRRILLLTLVEGLKPGEIAHQLGLSAEVVRARKSRALKRVVERVQELSRKRAPYHFVLRGSVR